MRELYLNALFKCVFICLSFFFFFSYPPTHFLFYPLASQLIDALRQRLGEKGLEGPWTEAREGGIEGG